MRWIAAILIGAMGFSAPPGQAARDLTAHLPPASARELVVFESESCLYCRVFRRDVLPGYLDSRHAADVPIRFLDVARTDPATLALAEPLTTLPTTVLVIEAREAGRIAGLTDPDDFLRLVAHLLDAEL
jgi:thioredoxin-related protein